MARHKSFSSLFPPALSLFFRRNLRRLENLCTINGTSTNPNNFDFIEPKTRRAIVILISRAGHLLWLFYKRNLLLRGNVWLVNRRLPRRLPVTVSKKHRTDAAEYLRCTVFARRRAPDPGKELMNTVNTWKSSRKLGTFARTKGPRWSVRNVVVYAEYSRDSAQVAAGRKPNEPSGPDE